VGGVIGALGGVAIVIVVAVRALLHTAPLNSGCMVFILFSIFIIIII
jgi:hypothetical protein